MKLVDLVPLKEGAFGMSAKDLAATYSLERLEAMRDEIMIDMENDPSVEPEGGERADYYGGTLNGLDQAIALKQPKKDVPYDVAVGKMTQDEYDKYMSTVAPNKAAFTKSSKFDRMNESTEKAWNAVDVSRKAEKEISNKEWNERTTKKLDMLKALNSAGKFKKDFDDERLQGWVDQNYSWEKLSRQFKLNEVYSEMYNEMKVTDKDGNDVTSDIIKKMEKSLEKAGYKITKGYSSDADIRPGYKTRPTKEGFPMSQRPTYGQNFEPEDMDNPDEDLVIIGSGYLDIKSNFGERPPQTNGEYAEIGQKVVDQLHNGDKEAAMDYIMSQINEGSCGYSQEAPGGEELNTPGGVQSMDADDRTQGMLRKFIQREVKKLTTGKPPITKEGEDQSLDSKLKGLFSDKEWDKITNKPAPSFADLKPKSKEKK